MFSLRRIIGAPSATSALRAVAARQMTPLAAICASRGFSSFEGVSRGAAKLNKALEKELKYENENYTQLEDIESFLQESGFEFSESEESQNMVLTK